MKADPDAEIKTLGYRTSAAYRRALARLRRKLAASGIPAEAIASDPRLAEHAVAELAVRNGIRMPPPTEGPGSGGARAGAGRPKAAG